MLQKYSCFCTKGKEPKKTAVLNNNPRLREQGCRDVQGGAEEKNFKAMDLKEPETVIVVDNKAIGNGSAWYDKKKKASQKDL